MDAKLIGTRIRNARKARNMTTDQLAEYIEISSQSLSHIECGVRQTSLQTLINIADSLDYPLDYLAGRTKSFAETKLPPELEDENLTLEQFDLLIDMAKALIPYVKRIE